MLLAKLPSSIHYRTQNLVQATFFNAHENERHRERQRTYDAANQVIGWSYDAAGNLLDDGTTTYTYDALNRVVTTGSTTNAYNADGVLVQQGSTRYVQDLASPLSQILGDGTSTYVYSTERLYAQQGSTRTWYATDALGSVRQSLNDMGAATGSIFYDPWGQVQSGTVPTFGFTGELQQGANVYLRARWYNGQQGTFTSRDSFAGWPERPYSLQPYQYAYSAPTTWTDPRGQAVSYGGDGGDVQLFDAGAFERCVYSNGIWDSLTQQCRRQPPFAPPQEEPEQSKQEPLVPNLQPSIIGDLPSFGDRTDTTRVGGLRRPGSGIGIAVGIGLACYLYLQSLTQVGPITWPQTVPEPTPENKWRGVIQIQGSDIDPKSNPGAVKDTGNGGYMLSTIVARCQMTNSVSERGVGVRSSKQLRSAVM